MIRPTGFIRHTVSFTEAELTDIANEFAEYVAEDIGDLLNLAVDVDMQRELQLEIAHAIRAAIAELPHGRISPAANIRHAAYETMAISVARRLPRPGS